jgi:hypothetical protein
MRDTIDMAREAGFTERDAMFRKVFVAHTKDLKVFEALVRADEREACADECVKQAIKGGFPADCASAIRARGNT